MIGVGKRGMERRGLPLVFISLSLSSFRRRGLLRALARGRGVAVPTRASSLGCTEKRSSL